MGVEFPFSGNGARHRTWLFVFQCTNTSVSVEIPVPSGPRQAGQFPA
jgi:hypothetical protein